MAFIYDKFNLLYIRVPKTGSTSFMRSLEVSGAQPKTCGRGHGDALEALKILGPVKFSSYERIAFVREPMAWARSYQIFRHAFERGLSGSRYLDAIRTPYDWFVDEDGQVMVDHIYRIEDMGAVTAKYGLMPCHYNKTVGLPRLEMTADEQKGARVKFAREYKHYED